MKEYIVTLMEKDKYSQHMGIIANIFFQIYEIINMFIMLGVIY